MRKLPLISVVIPTFNEEKRIVKCLNSIKSQDYPKKFVEIIIVDDDSTDNTVKIAKSYGARILLNGNHNIERGKSIGFEKSKGEYLFFIDADNVLTSKKWFSESINIFFNNPEVVGIEGWRVKYKKNESLINRYSALFGVTDPIVFYLRRKGWLMYGEDWTKSKSFIKDEKKYYLEKYDIKNLPTIGSNGYMISKKMLKKTDWKPYLFHLDSTYDLVKNGHNVFARIKFDIEHDYAQSLFSAMKKIKRNTYLFMKYKNIRRYKYDISFSKLFLTSLVMVTFVVPAIDGLAGFFKKRDVAWLFHPIISFVVIFVYGFSVLSQGLKLVFVKKNV